MIATRERRSELLAAAAGDDLVALADRCVEQAGEPALVRAPEVGMVMLTVREPVEATRFHLGEVLVTQAEVEHRGARGWAMRMGEEPLETLAAAILDAEADADGPLRGEVDELCRRAERDEARLRRAEWAELVPTIVHFEELD